MTLSPIIKAPLFMLPPNHDSLKLPRCRNRWPAMAVFAFVFCLSFSSSAFGTPNPNAVTVKRTAEKTVSTDVNTQKVYETWADEKQDLMQEIDDLTTRLKRIQWKQMKAKTYRKTLETKITDLNRRAEEMAEVEMALLPVLDETVDRLGKQVESDIPMGIDERKKIVMQTRRILNDYDATLLNKTRAVLEAVSREVDLGYTVQVEEDEILVDEQPIQVKLLRVGRVGLYALTMDAAHAFTWNRNDSRYEPLPENRIREITEAIEMAEGVRIIELSRLPIALPELKHSDSMKDEGNK